MKKLFAFGLLLILICYPFFCIERVDAFTGDNVFVIRNQWDWQNCGFSDYESLPVYTEIGLTNFYMPIALNKSFVKNLKLNEIDYEFKFQNQHFNERFKKLKFDLLESSTFYVVLFKMYCSASVNSFSVDMIPSIKGIKYTQYGYWNSSFSRRIDLFVNSSQIENNLVNYPVCVYFASNTSLGSIAQDDGDDLRFVDTTNTTIYNSELEYFDGGSGKLVAWINITEVSSTVDTHFNLYYGNSSVGALPSANITGTWDSYYELVCHMSDLSGSIQDSTSHNEDSIAESLEQYNSTGIIYGATKYERSSVDYAQFSLNNLIMNKYTIEGWAKAESISASGNMDICGDVPANGQGLGLRFQMTNDRFHLELNDNGASPWELNTYTNDNTADTSDVWYYVVGRGDGTNADVLINGSINYGGCAVCDNTTDACIGTFMVGARDGSPNYKFDGDIDEFRISSIERNNSYLLANWNNAKNLSQTNPFIIIGNIEVYEEVSPWSNTCPSSSSPNPNNQSTGVSINVGNWSVTISDVDGNTTDGSIWVSNGNTSTWNTKGNGTRGVDLSTLSYNTNYTVWVNFSDEYCTKNNSFWFITETEAWSNTCPSSSSPNPSNNSVNNNINSDFSITISDVDGNTTSGTIFCNNSNNMSWSNLGNGSRSLTLDPLSYSTQYTLWVNFSDEFCTVNDTFYFTTEANVSNVTYATESWVHANFVASAISFETDALLFLLFVAFVIFAEWKKDFIYYIIAGVIGLSYGVHLLGVFTTYPYRIFPIGILLTGAYLFYLALGLVAEKLRTKSDEMGDKR